ncbi:TonB-dependent receptor [Phenylobacterium sp.]|uniref:TonB-dependent receptor n=1 Tax=Phenylobacterium sp. TaxID=1871053 RepID=UPI002DF30176|nr:TonB-dependent receptor [Phenylobacterium sp.]
MLVALAGLGAAVTPQAAHAATRIFRLPSESLEEALVRFAVQGDVSVGGLPATGCTGRSRPVQGAMSPQTALAAMLPPGCGFRTIDARTFQVIGGRAGAPAGPASPVMANAVAPLVVTAERRPEPLTGAPYPASALTGASLQRLGGDSFEDVAAQFVGVTVTNLGPGRNKIFIRGLSDGSFTGKTQSTVGLYLDDLPITYDAPDPDLRLVDVDRVEVLRGPQGTLYGSGSIGGIVRIVTAKPDPAARQAWAEAGVEATEHGANSSGWAAMLNLPMFGGRSAVRAVAYRDDIGGFIDNPPRRLRDLNSSRRTGGRIAWAADLGSGWRVDANLAHQTIDTNAAQYAQGPFGPLTRNTEVREPHDNNFTQLGLGLVHAGAWADLKVSAGFVQHGLDTTYDATGAFVAVDETPGAVKAYDEGRRVDLGVLEATLTSTTPGRLRWLAGMFATHTREKDSALLRFVTPPGDSLTLYHRRDELAEEAIYGEAAYDLTSRFTLTAGLRAFISRTSTVGDDFGLAGDPTEVVHGKHINRGVAPKLRLSYAFAPDVALYAQAQEGYRAGGFNLPSFARRNPGPVVGAVAFRPDRMWNYEVGGVAPLFDGRLVLRAAVFHAEWRSVQTDQYFANGLPLTVNVGDGSNTGLETEFLWRPDERLQVRASILLNDPQLTRTTRLLPATPDKGLPGVPYGTAAADVRYRWPVGHGFSLETSAEANYVGRSYVTFDAGKDALMGGYGAGRVAATLEKDRWRVESYVSNVTDGTANTFAFGNPFSRARARQTTPLRPRTVGLRVTRSF